MQPVKDNGTAPHKSGTADPAGLEGLPEQVDPVHLWSNISFREAEFIEKVDTGYAISIARHIAKYKNNARGFRLAGTEANYRVVKFLKQEMIRIGIPDVTLEDFTLQGWSYEEAYLSINEIICTAIPYVSTPPTTPMGITAPLIYIGSGTREECRKHKIDGKIVLLGLDYNMFPWPSLVALQAESFGAAAVVIFNVNRYGQGNNGSAYSQASWKDRVPNIPVVNVSPKCGLSLARESAGRELEATLFSKTVTDYPVKAYNLLGLLPGSRYQNENIVINAHYDAFFQGFQESALAVGTGMAIMKALLDSQCRLQRNIILSLVDGDKFGRKGPGIDTLAGSWNLLESNKNLCGRTIAAINLELMAYHGSRVFGVRSCHELLTFLTSFSSSYFPDIEVFSELNLQTYKGVSTRTSEWTFNCMGIPSSGVRAEPEIIENYYHTQLDTEELACSHTADEMVRLYGSYLQRIDGCLFHPYDFSLRALDYVAAIDVKDLAVMGIDAKEAVAAAKDFAAAAKKKMKELLKAEEKFRKMLTAGVKASKLAPLRRKSKVINAEYRVLAKEILSASNFLERNCPKGFQYRSQHYQHDFMGLCYLEEKIAAGDIKKAARFMADAEKCIQGLEYVPYMTREVYLNHYLGYFLKKPEQPDFLCCSGRSVYYHDLWKEALDLLKAQTNDSCINTLKKVALCREKAAENLRISLLNDTALWRRAYKRLQEMTSIPGEEK